MENLCTWTPNIPGEYYDTNCDQIFVLIEGTPAQNNFNFCPYCGRKLKEAKNVRHSKH